MRQNVLLRQVDIAAACTAEAVMAVAAAASPAGDCRNTAAVINSGCECHTVWR